MVRLGVVVTTLSLGITCAALAGGGGAPPPRNQGETQPAPVTPVTPIEPAPVAPAPIAPVAPVAPAPIAPVEPTPIAPVEPTPVAPVEPTPIAPVEPTPIAPTPIEPAPVEPVTPVEPVAPVAPTPITRAPTEVDADRLVQLRGRLVLREGQMVLEELRARPPFVRAQRHPIKLIGDDVAPVHSAIHRLMGLLPEVVVSGNLLGEGGLDRRFQAARISNPGGDRAFAHSALLGGPRTGELSLRPLRLGELRVLNATPEWERHLTERAGQQASAEGWLLLDRNTPRAIVLSRVDGRSVGEGPPAAPVEPPVPTELPPGEKPGGMAGVLQRTTGEEGAPSQVAPVSEVAPVTPPVTQTEVAPTPIGPPVAQTEVGPTPIAPPEDRPLGEDGPIAPVTDAPPITQSEPLTPQPPLSEAPLAPLEPPAQQQQGPAFPTRVRVDKALWTIARELRAQLTPEQRAQGLTITTPMLMLANGLVPGQRPANGRELVVPPPAAARPLLVPAADGRPGHWAQEGESLWGIARAYGTTVSDLLRENPALAERVASQGAERALRAGDDVLRLPQGSRLEAGTQVQPGRSSSGAR